MLCPKCHKNVPETAAFCNVCGTPLNQNKPGMMSASLGDVISKEEWATTMVEKEEEATNASKANAPRATGGLFDAVDDVHHDAEPTYRSDSEAEYVHTYSKVAPQKKSPLKAIITVVIILAVLAVGVILCLPWIKSMFMSPANRYISTEAEVFREIGKELNLYTEAKHPDNAHIEADVKASVNGNIEGMNEVKALLDKIGFKATIDVDLANDKAYTAFDVTNNGASVARLIAQQDNTNMALQTEGGENVYVSLARALETSNLTDDKDYKDKFGVSKKEYDAYVLGAFDAAVNEALNDKNVIKDKAEFEGMDCKTVTFLIDDDKVRSMLINLALYIEENPNTKVIFGDYLIEVCQAMELNEVGGTDLDAINADEAIARVVNMLKEEAGKIEFTEQYQYKVFYNKSTIVNRQVTTNIYPNDSLSLATYKKAGTTFIRLTVAEDGIKAVAAFDYTSNKETIIGGGKVTVEGEEIAPAGSPLEIITARYNLAKNTAINGINAFAGDVIISASIPMGTSQSNITISSTTTGAVQDNVNTINSNVSIKVPTGESMGVELNVTETITPQADVSKINVPTSGNAEYADVIDEFVEKAVTEILMSGM